MLTRILALTIMLTVLPAVLLCQTLTATSSDITDVHRGISYKISPNPSAAHAIVPYDHGEVGCPVKFQLRADAGSQWRLNMLMGWYCPGSCFTIQTFYDDSSGYLREEHTSWNPNLPKTITMGNGGVVTVFIAPAFGVPVEALSGDVAYSYVMCIATRMNDGFALDTATQISITAASTCLGVPTVDGHVDSLALGHAYTLDPLTESVSPIINGNENGSPTGFNIVADPGQNILVHLTLPQYLIGEHSDSIPCTFNGTSLVRLDDTSFVDPNGPHVFNSGTGERVRLRLGISIMVPREAGGGMYSGTVSWTAAYAGGVTNTLAFNDGCSAGGSGYTAFTVRVIPPLPKEYALHQNFPNPFNSGTTIRYDLPEAAGVSLKVYDLLGREVATLFSGFQRAGELRTTWDASGVSSGVYLYRIRAANYSDTRKLIIAR